MSRSWSLYRTSIICFCACVKTNTHKTFSPTVKLFNYKIKPPVHTQITYSSMLVLNVVEKPVHLCGP
uniref:Uncharacterized protein n=1 Tax=Arion vulgaris TaxID=1028688 RepID=A0A0B6ZKW6_9EUPU